VNGDSPRLRLSVVGIVAVSLFAALFARLWYLQVMAADEYQVAARTNSTRTVPVEAARNAMVGMGFSEWLAASLCEFYMPPQLKQIDVLSNDVQAVLGRPARSFGEWAKEFGGAFK
jgi:hypothetical protein